jgi:hypothetical protein
MPNPISIQVKDASGTNQTVSTLDAVLASTLQVGGSVTVANFPASQAVTGPLTDAQLRATAVPVAVSFPATQAISGSVAVSNLPASQAVTGPLTDAQLRATAVPVVVSFPATQPVSAASLPLPTGAATEASLGTIGTAPPTLPGTSTGIMGLLRWIGSLSTLGAGTAAAAQRVVIATDQTAVPAYAPSIAYTDRSGTITTGGTAQTLMAANANRKGWRIQNLSPTDLWVNDKGAAAVAAQPSFKLAAGASYESAAFGASTAAISIFGATTGQSFEAMEA